MSSTSRCAFCQTLGAVEGDSWAFLREHARGPHRKLEAPPRPAEREAVEATARRLGFA